MKSYSWSWLVVLPNLVSGSLMTRHLTLLENFLGVSALNKHELPEEGQALSLQSHVSVEPKLFASAANRLRGMEWDCDDAFDQPKLLDVLRWLDAMAHHAKGGLEHLANLSGTGKLRCTQYHAEAMIQSVRTCGLLRADSKLKQVIEMVSGFLGYDKDWLSEQVKLPLKFLQASIGTNAVLTLGRIHDTLRNADAAFLESLSKHTKIYKATVGPSQTLWTPWGYLLVEATANNAPISGVRWCFASDYVSPGFVELAKLMLPDDPSNVKPNSSIATMATVVSALQSMANAPDMQLQPVKQESLTHLTSLRPAALVKRQPVGDFTPPASRVRMGV